MNYYSKKVYWNRKCMIPVNLFQNCIEGHFSSSLEHHTKAFGTLLSALFTYCHNISHDPLLALYQGKNETEVPHSVLSSHFVLSTKIQNWFWWVAEVSVNSPTEHCSLAELKVQKHYNFIVSEFLINSLQPLFTASLVLLTKKLRFNTMNVFT